MGFFCCALPLTVLGLVPAGAAAPTQAMLFTCADGSGTFSVSFDGFVFRRPKSARLLAVAVRLDNPIGNELVVRKTLRLRP